MCSPGVEAGPGELFDGFCLDFAAVTPPLIQGGFSFSFYSFHPGLLFIAWNCLLLQLTAFTIRLVFMRLSMNYNGKMGVSLRAYAFISVFGSAWITNGGYLFSLSFLNSDLRLGKRWYICTNTYISKRVLLFSLRLVFLFNFLPVVIYRRFD